MSGSEVRQPSSITMPPRSPTREAGCARQLVARPDAGREHHDVRLEVGAVGESACVRMRSPATISTRLLAGVDAHAELCDSRAQHATARLVDLHRHQTRRELHDMRLQTADPCSALAASRPEQPAADDDAARAPAPAARMASRSSMVR